MDEGTPLGGLESEDNAKPSHGLHAVLSSLWGRGHPAYRLRIRFPEDEGVQRPKQSNQPETSRWATWCFGYDKTPEGVTSSRLPGKGHSSSPRF
jgi:hypothetical protein